MITYLLQVAICWGLFLGLYHITLRKETFFMVNRAYLLLTIILGLLIPRVTWDTSMFMEQPTVGVAIDYMTYGFEQMTAVVSPTAPIHFDEVSEQQPMGALAMIYWIGVLFMMAKLLMGIAKILWMRRGARMADEGDHRIAHTNVDHAPFTFFGTIYLSETRSDQDNDPAILVHESAHVSGWHTIDVLFIQLVKAFFWFNPLVYGYDHALKTVHEYIADANVLQRTALQRYGRLLLRQAQPGLEIALANHFYNHQLKKRFKMMTRTPSQKRMLLKYLSVLPFILIVSLVFTNQTVQAEISKVEEIDLSELLESSQLQEFKEQMDLAELKFQESEGDARAKLLSVCEIISSATTGLDQADRLAMGEIKLNDGKLSDIHLSYIYDSSFENYRFRLDYNFVNYIPGRFTYFDDGELCWLIDDPNVKFQSAKKVSQFTYDINWNPLRFPFLKITRSRNALDMKTVRFIVKNKSGTVLYDNPTYTDSWNGSFDNKRSIKDGTYEYTIIEQDATRTEGQLIIERDPAGEEVGILIKNIHGEFVADRNDIDLKLQRMCPLLLELNKVHLNEEYGVIRSESFYDVRNNNFFIISGDKKMSPSEKKDLHFILIVKNKDPRIIKISDLQDCFSQSYFDNSDNQIHPRLQYVKILDQLESSLQNSDKSYNSKFNNALSG